jgi:glycosyltransferase involved in cell wall biosynthesis
LANYRGQCKFRLPVKDFAPGTSLDTYIFFSSTIWNEEQAPGTNQRRTLFLDVCKSLKQIDFEGGFSPTAVPDLASRYGMHFTSKRFSLHEWLDKTRRSAVVFYTPAVWLSHTFKLAEFLALGKAIISTAISRELPAPLIHGTHVHFVDDSPESYRGAIELILKDSDYRAFLEQNARKYYLDNLTPERVIHRLSTHGR